MLPLPFKNARPSVGLVFVARMRMSFDFPAPLGPKRPSTPGPSSRENSRSPQKFPLYRFPTPSIVSFMALVSSPSLYVEGGGKLRPGLGPLGERRYSGAHVQSRPDRSRRALRSRPLRSRPLVRADARDRRPPPARGLGRGSPRSAHDLLRQRRHDAGSVHRRAPRSPA